MDIEAQIQAKGLTGPRVTPDDIKAAIVQEFYFTAADGVRGAGDRTDQVNRFLQWPVPATVYPDGTPGQPGRTGTNLLTAVEASDMLGYVLDTGPASAPLGLLTFCVLVLANGWTVTGESAVVYAENFDADVGRTVAKAKAVEKVWPLLGFLLRDKLSGFSAVAAAPAQSFGAAIEAVKAGKRVARSTWMPGTFIFVNAGSIDGKAEGLVDGVPGALFQLGDIGTVTRLPNISMRTPTGSTDAAWSASQTDLLAEDWVVLA